MSCRLGLVWVVVESVDGQVRPAGLEMLGWAQTAAASVEGVHWGPDAEAVASVVGRHGAARVLSAGDPGDLLPGATVAAAMAVRVESGEIPDLVMFATTHDQRDIIGRLSARLDRPVMVNAVGMSVAADDGGLLSEHEVFGGTTVVTARSTAGPPNLVMVRPRSFEAVVVDGSSPPAEVLSLVVVTAMAGPAASAARVRRRHRDVVVRGAGPALDHARVVVAAGRGLGPENRFALVEELACLLGGAAAATRAAVDAGWASFPVQVGQTGRTVKPDDYLALGVSGAAQHLVGMKDARTIIAVNTDPRAPIMSLADLAVVGDAPSILARLLTALSSA
ncbi:MAG: electron transfer flavoprotein subunit alpha/FixB family protein [Acidimicrobiales bacterium]